MGFFNSIFSKEERQKKSFAKHLKLVVNKRVQSEERFQALYALRKNGSEEAIYGLLKRFTITAEGKGGSVVDAEEKEWVYDVILEFGEEALPSLRKFILAKEGFAVNPVHSISKSLDLIKTIVHNDKQYIFEMMKELIEANPPGYERDPIRKEEILNFLHDWDDPNLSKYIVSYLEDMNETIRFLTVEVLFKYGIEEISREPLLELFKPELDESRRIHNRILLGISENGWSIKGYRSFIDPLIKDTEYKIQRGDKLIKRKGK